MIIGGKGGSPAQLLLQVHHVLVTLGVVGCLGLHQIIQAAQMVSLNTHKQECVSK